MKIKKIIDALLRFFLAIVIIAFILWFWPASTPSIHSPENNSVAQIEYVKIGGMDQCILIRSENSSNPILLFLHGGPGMPMMYLAHEFQRPLEKHFTVVQWDRRGAGKTFSKNKPKPETITTRQIINDTYHLIDTLRNRYGQDKVILAGHSFGTYIGSIMTHERPDLFKAYISIGQVVDVVREKKIQAEFIKEQARLRGKKEIIKTLESGDGSNVENWLFEFGGELKNHQSFFPLIWSGLRSPEYKMAEVLDVAKGSSFSSKNMRYNVLSENIFSEITSYQLPVYFFVGRSDYTTPFILIEEYYHKINAQKKELVYFEESAHFPFFEEPEKFCSEIIRLLHGK